MTIIQVELSDATAQAACAAGLLTSQALERLLNQALRHQQVTDSLKLLKETMQEYLQAANNAVSME